MLKSNFQKEKNKAVNDRTLFFVLGLFCTPHSIFPNLSAIALSTKNQYSSFSKEVLVFFKTKQKYQK